MVIIRKKAEVEARKAKAAVSSEKELDRAKSRVRGRRGKKQLAREVREFVERELGLGDYRHAGRSAYVGVIL